MRIVAGKYGGRRLQTPKGRDIRPTSDKIRGAVFNMLRARGALEDAKVLDCFCGTGALGLEALSQGASSCIFIDKDKKSLDLARENADALGIGAEARFILKDALKLPPRAEDSAPVNLVFLDPPYNKGLILPCLENLCAQVWLEDGAVLVAEAEKNFSQAIPAPYEILDERVYGETKVMLLRFS